jgi:hypothetical protein
MRSIALNSVVAIDDDAAILYEGTDLVEVLSWREGATAYRLKRDSDEIHEHSLSAKIIGSLPVKAAREPVLVEVESKRACVGRYELTNPMQVSFTMEGEQLFAQYGAQPKLPIFPQSETEYFWTVVDAQVTFQKDSNGHVTSFVHHQNGRDTSGVRVAD